MARVTIRVYFNGTIDTKDENKTTQIIMAKNCSESSIVRRPINSIDAVSSWICENTLTIVLISFQLFFCFANDVDDDTNVELLIIKSMDSVIYFWVISNIRRSFVTNWFEQILIHICCAHWMHFLSLDHHCPFDGAHCLMNNNKRRYIVLEPALHCQCVALLMFDLTTPTTLLTYNNEGQTPVH